MVYTNWGTRQPTAANATTPGCVAMDGKADEKRQKQGGFWYDMDCNAKLPTVCRITDKKPPKNLTVYPGKCPDVSLRIPNHVTLSR